MSMFKINLMSVFRLLVALVFLLGLSSCANNSPFVFDDGKLISRLNDTKIAELQSQLKMVKDGNVPDGMTGGIVIDCHAAEKLTTDKYGQQIYLVKPDRIFLGASEIGNGKIKLVSPTMENGGVELFSVGQYRIFAVKLNNDSDSFYIWKGTVLVRTEN